MGDIYEKITKNIIVTVNEQIETDVIGVVRDIATENGFDKEIVLNKKGIIKALSNTVAKKTGFCTRTNRMYCPTCQNYVTNNVLGKRDFYCVDCGQKLTR